MSVSASGQPDLDLWGLVGGVIVHHQMHVRPLWNCGVDPFQKVEELGCAMALVAFADHRADCDVERGKQRCGAAADVGVGSPFGDARCYRQHRLFPIQSLDGIFRSRTA